MKWFKHNSNANMDAKLQEVLLDYGLEGYGLYWYCLELVAGTVEPENLTFALEHDCRIIARNVGSTPQKVQEMMKKFIDLGLFENSHGVITCLRLAKASDEYTTKILSRIKKTIDFKALQNSGQTPDKLRTKSDKVRLDKIREDKKRKDKKHIVQSDDYTAQEPESFSDDIVQKAFESIWIEYPKRNGAKGGKAQTLKLCKGICSKHEDWEKLYRTVKQYRLWADHNGKTGTDMVMQTTTFFGKQKQGYLEDWSISTVQPVNTTTSINSQKQTGASILKDTISALMEEQNKQDNNPTPTNFIEGDFKHE